ncbi:polysaccharide pyruvyl transferase CsaB [Bordetella ansorpii]|uniref:Polysaccharide pyruvyl transferase CsaB n=1 Tax=Bordetella ansorpii TaxID=288768 RepID=A0A157MA85_9BORD|nr:polysaccharide pyruvyl transferase family protein [Bordetella ansorpii]SAI05686.1 polysaccharide pyruvyl transferase CsaB [Bordetella ansorpii]
MTVAILLISTEAQSDYAGIGDTAGLNASDVLKLSGVNVGNFAFKYGMRKLIGEDVIYTTYRTDPDYVRRNARALIVAEANLVNPGIDYGAPAKFIETVDLPTFCLGIGAQAGTMGDKITIPAGTLDYLHAVSKRSAGFGVRGAYTKSIIDELGVSGAQVLGCPSFFINPSRTLWQDVARKIGAEDFSSIALMEGIYPTGHPHAEKVSELERRLFDLVRFRNSDYITQAHPTIMAFAMGDGHMVEDSTLFHLRKRLAPGMRIPEFRELLAARSRVHVRIDHWIRDVRRYQAVIGTRIHGTIMALQAERPAAMISHDSRTSELCETLQIPVTSLDQAMEVPSVGKFDRLFEKIAKNTAAQRDDHRIELGRKIRNLMNEMEIPASPAFNALCDGAPSTAV